MHESQWLRVIHGMFIANVRRLSHSLNIKYGDFIFKFTFMSSSYLCLQ